MIKRFSAVIIILLGIIISGEAQVRDAIRIPDIPGYVTLKYDPHMHTVFSDGNVWPTVRVHEAWREGLDAISITDHIEYRPFSDDVISDHNRAYEVARPLAGQLDILLIHGTEITRAMPPGHFNAVFLEDANPIDLEDWRDAMKAAKAQDAFIFWNHPGWASQQPDTTLWWEEHTWLLENGMLHGIEVVNGGSYYPEAHMWCLEKNLTMIGTTDIHNPIGMDYDLSMGERRPMTLVFAREQSGEAIKEALFAGRTAVYFQDKLVGREEYLDALFDESLQVISVTRHRGSYGITLFNPTDIPIEISKARGNDPAFEFFRTTTVPAGGYRNISIYINDTSEYDQIELKLNIDNFLVEPGKGLPVKLTFVPDDL
ncbi:MAG: histidinol-phosphatase [Bacteroidales bacterium]